MNTRKINETPILEQATAETNVLVEHGGTASRIPASALGGGSEKALIDKLAPAFKKTGAVVTCNPVEGHPLDVVSHLQNIATDLLSGVKQVFDDEAQISYMQTYAPAGEYTVWAKQEGYGMSVVAYNAKTASWDSIGDIPMNVEDEGTLTFTHNGGVLRVVGSWVQYFEATLKPKVTPNGIAWVALEHNGEFVVEEFPKAVRGGSFHWATGELHADNSAPNLVADYKDDSKWQWDHPEMQNYELYEIPDLPKGRYTLYCGIYSVDARAYNEELGGFDVIASYIGAPISFDHAGGALQLCDVMGDHTANDYVLVLQAGSEYAGPSFETYQLTPHEIVGLAGVNTLSSNTGDTEVSGRADPAFVINDLYSKLSALSEG